MKELGEYYAHAAKSDLALPLFLKSLEFVKPDSCQSVLIRKFKVCERIKFMLTRDDRSKHSINTLEQDSS